MEPFRIPNRSGYWDLPWLEESDLVEVAGVDVHLLILYLSRKILGLYALWKLDIYKHICFSRTECYCLEI